MFPFSSAVLCACGHVPSGVLGLANLENMLVCYRGHEAHRTKLGHIVYDGGFGDGLLNVLVDVWSLVVRGVFGVCRPQHPRPLQPTEPYGVV